MAVLLFCFAAFQTVLLTQHNSPSMEDAFNGTDGRVSRLPKMPEREEGKKLGLASLLLWPSSPAQPSPTRDTLLCNGDEQQRPSLTLAPLIARSLTLSLSTRPLRRACPSCSCRRRRRYSCSSSFLSPPSVRLVGCPPARARSSALPGCCLGQVNTQHSNENKKSAGRRNDKLLLLRRRQRERGGETGRPGGRVLAASAPLLLSAAPTEERGLLATQPATH